MSPSVNRETRVGVCVPIFAHPGGSFFRTPNWTRLEPDAAMSFAVLAERLGFDSLWVADHLIHGNDGGILEGWSTIAYLAGRTKRIRLGTIHLAHLFRPPSLTAKMAATLDALSGGRLIFFYDLGGSEPESSAYGYQPPPLDERITRMDEGLSLIRTLWTADSPVSFTGAYYRTDRAVCLPRPRQNPTPPIWLGEIRDDPWCDVVARHANGWNSVPVSVDGYRARLERLMPALKRAGRDPTSIELSLEIEVLIGPDRQSIRLLADRIASHEPGGPVHPRDDLLAFLRASDPSRDWQLPLSYEDRVLVGTPDEVIDRIRQYQDVGVRHFLLWFLDFPERRGIELFAERVLPRIT